LKSFVELTEEPSELKRGHVTLLVSTTCHKRYNSIKGRQFDIV
jgi:hypothetical protein